MQTEWLEASIVKIFCATSDMLFSFFNVAAAACRLSDQQVVQVLTNNKEVQRITVDAMPIMLPTFVCEWSLLSWYPLVSKWVSSTQLQRVTGPDMIA